MNLKKSVIAAIFLKTEKNNQSPINLINVKNTSTAQCDMGIAITLFFCLMTLNAITYNNK